MSTLIPFDFEDQAVRILMRDGEPWFVAVDICRVLELSNPTEAVKRLDEDEVTLSQIEGSHRQTNIVSESGLYALVIRSDKPAAKRFRKWITAEVLPAIRRDGRYEHPSIAPAAPDTADLGAMRDGEFWLSLIREARLLGGTRAGRAMWARSPLPPLSPSVLLAVDPAQGRACLDHLMCHGDVAAHVYAAREGEEAAYEALTTYGLRVKPGGLFVANGNHPGILQVFAGTPWANGMHRQALLSLPGAISSDAVYKLGGLSCRGIVIPLGAADEGEVRHG